MSSTFFEHQTRSILQRSQTATSKDIPEDRIPTTARQQRLQTLIGELSQPVKREALIQTLDKCLKEVEDECLDEEEAALEWATLGRAVVGVYTEVMSSLLAQAIQADEEADWWRRVEQVGGGTAWYLLQTMPWRVIRLGRGMVSTIRSQQHQITLQTFSLQNLDRIFTPNLLSHLFRRSFFPSAKHPYDFFRTNPIELTRQECRARRIELEKIRDRRAKSLGQLANVRRVVEKALIGKGSTEHRKENVASVLEILEASLEDDPFIPPILHPDPVKLQAAPRKLHAKDLTIPGTTRTVLPRLQIILAATLPTYSTIHDQALEPLRRPGRLTQLWPKLVLYPPLAFFAFKLLFNSTVEFFDTMKEAKETVIGFWNGWVVEPIAGILNTVRGSPDDSPMVVSKEGLHSDMDSLERMVLSLASEKLKYTPEQLEDLSNAVRQGDLTPVLRIYEQDIKSPLSSVIRGSLVRSLLIQIQKTKVDVDLALTGIDRLLQSQQLTFAFVGVAPSLAVLYIFGGWLRSTVLGASGKGRLGGFRRRESTLIAMRRIERLLNNPTAGLASRSFVTPETPGSDSDTESPQITSPPLTQGLLLLSVTHLRSYAIECLPARSNLQQAFLEDVEDLEDATGKLTREDQLRVVDRMWRTYGRLLGWNGDAIGCET
ncbi:Nuclear control of ATPase protein 2 [Tulasnella sp. 424]|nr:Nuclear control of ATPase protein 2 [Tulasnella sp. 424]KAG8970285.1 Nuclear control of ATPase protein 2 [Tulasnella sp. 425]